MTRNHRTNVQMISGQALFYAGSIVFPILRFWSDFIGSSLTIRHDLTIEKRKMQYLALKQELRYTASCAFGCSNESPVFQKSCCVSLSGHEKTKQEIDTLYQSPVPDLVLQRGLARLRAGRSRGKRATGTFSNTAPFESPSFEYQKTEPPCRVALFFGAPAGTRTPASLLLRNRLRRSFRFALKTLRVLVSVGSRPSNLQKQADRTWRPACFWCSSGDSNPGHPA